MEKCFKYHEFSGSIKPIVPADNERLLTLMRDVNNWTKPRDLQLEIHQPNLLLLPQGHLSLLRACVPFSHTQAERPMHQEKSVKYSPVTNPTETSAVEKGYSVRLQDHCWQGWVNKKRSIINLIQI